MNTDSAMSRAWLMARNGYRVANVIANRYLGRPPRYAPILLMFLTDRCNLHCKMCGFCEHEHSTPSKPELTTEEWKAVVRSAVKLGTTMISMSGGEPFLRPDVFEIIRYIRDQHIAVHLCSNGVLLNREKILRLRDSGLNTISISLESPDRDIHEQLRGRRSFDPAIESIRLIRELAPSIRVGINYLITTVNFRNMGAMIPFAESLGVDQVKFAPIHTNLLHKRKRIEHYGNLIFGSEELEDLESEIRALMREAEHSKLETTSPMFFSGIANLYSKPMRFRCYAGYAACAIDPSGLVAPCCDMDGAVSVRDKPLEEIWRSKEFQELRGRVHRCNSSCWDTTNAELSLRLKPTSLIRDLAQTWRDIGFYFRDTTT